MKYLVLLLIVLGGSIPIQEIENSTVHSISTELEEAFKVLTNKCNVCHAIKNPNKVFTLENMNEHASKIKWQVFVWKRMPKGNKIKLTDQEKQILKNWISNLQDK